MDGLGREERLASARVEATSNAVKAQAAAEVALLNKRVSSLEHANADLRATRGAATAEARAAVAAVYDGRVASLERERDTQAEAVARREELVADRLEQTPLCNDGFPQCP